MVVGVEQAYVDSAASLAMAKDMMGSELLGQDSREDLALISREDVMDWTARMDKARAPLLLGAVFSLLLFLVNLVQHDRVVVAIVVVVPVVPAPAVVPAFVPAPAPVLVPAPAPVPLPLLPAPAPVPVWMLRSQGLRCAGSGTR
eukprot:2105896-Rhodomonas_salina.1